MKNQKIKNSILYVLFGMLSFTAQAQVTAGDIKGELDSAKDDIFAIIDIIMAIVIMGGVIYVATALIGKREMSKGVIIGWLGAMLIWGLAKALVD